MLTLPAEAFEGVRAKAAGSSAWGRSRLTHPFDDFTRPIATSGRQGKTVRVGPNTVLGYNAVIMAGVSIGERCIVGANSVVTKDVPDFTVVGGVPAKVIKQINPPEGDPSVWRPGG